MMTTKETPSYRFVYWLHIVLMIPAVIVAIWMWLDFILRPSLQDLNAAGGYEVALLSLLVAAPLTIAVGFWCLYRARGNVVGALLVLWGCGIVGIVLDRHTFWVDTYNYFYAGIIWPALFFLLVYYPNGRVYPSWLGQWADRLVVLTYIFWVLSAFSTQFFSLAIYPNAFYITFLEPLKDTFTSLGGLAMLPPILIGIRSLVFQFREGEPMVRQQIKWLLLGTFPVMFLIIPQLFLVLVLNIRAEGSLSTLIGNIIQVYLLFFPVIAVGNAILRHRLYDIDIIIRRTLVYATLTTILAVVYFGGIILIQRVFQLVTGQKSEVAIVISTLLIIALFTPLRRAVQNWIDRRFYRRKYDAQQTIARFNETLRDEVDLETLKANLIGVVQETLQPTTIRLWVKE